MNKSEKQGVMLLLPNGWKVKLFTAELDSLGITAEQWQPSHPAINEDAKSIDILINPGLTVITDAVSAAVVMCQVPKTSSFESLLVLILEKMEDREWRKHFEKESPGDLAHLESLLSAIRGYFTEEGVTAEQSVLLARAGFPCTAMTGYATSESMRRGAADIAHLKLNGQIDGIIQAHEGDTGLRLALEQLSRDIRRNLFAFVGQPIDQQ